MQMRIDTKIMVRIETYIKKYEYARERVLFKLGGYVQKTMQRSMRYKKPGGKPSVEGSPPKALKTNPRLRKGIGFIVEKRAGKVVIGPDTFDKRRKMSRARPIKSSMTVPRLLNEGGPMLVSADPAGNPVFDAAYRWTPKNSTIRVEMRPRPFVKPAREKGEQRFLELLAKNQIRR